MNVRENRKEQSGTDNPEKLAAVGTQDTCKISMYMLEFLRQLRNALINHIDFNLVELQYITLIT